MAAGRISDRGFDLGTTNSVVAVMEGGSRLTTHTRPSVEVPTPYRTRRGSQGASI